MDNVDTKPQRASGQIESMTIKLDGSLTMNVENMDFNSLTLLVGTNGVGKSIILKFSWLLGFIARSYISAKVGGVIIDPKDVARYGFDGSFKHPDFTGMLKANYVGNHSIELHMNSGEVTDVVFEGFENLIDFPEVRFLSSDMRTFDSISTYLKQRKRILDNLEPEYQTLPPEAAAVVKMRMDGYMLYDIFHIERLIAKSPFDFPESTITTLVNDFQFESGIKSFGVDLDRCDFYVMIGDQKKYMTTYGKGHQSIMNMLVGNI